MTRGESSRPDRFVAVVETPGDVDRRVRTVEGTVANMGTFEWLPYVVGSSDDGIHDPPSGTPVRITIERIG